MYYGIKYKYWTIMWRIKIYSAQNKYNELSLNFVKKYDNIIFLKLIVIGKIHQAIALEYKVRFTSILKLISDAKKKKEIWLIF